MQAVVETNAGYRRQMRLMLKSAPSAGPFLNQPTHTENQNPQTRNSKFLAKVVFGEADVESMQHFKQADGLNEFGNPPERALQQ
jgi:hypothetical protein